MKLALPVAVALALVVAAEPAPDWGEVEGEWTGDYSESRALCRSVRDREPPESDRPSAGQRAALEGCDSEALYYGIGRPADPDQARLCAFVEAEKGEDGPFSGRAMLMTIYANGVGARRDLDVAAHLACQTWWAPAEAHGRVTRLARAKSEGWAGTDFHFCDDVTSGHIGGHCAGHGARIADSAREAAIANLAAGWSDPEKRAFAALRAAQEAFAAAHADGEVDMSGTLRGVFWIDAQQARRDEFVETLRRVAEGRVPGDGAAGFRAADAELNAVYRQVMRGEFGDLPGSVTATGVRNAQRAWLRYRDAFLAFAAAKFPAVSRDGLAALLTRQRTATLRGGLQ